MDKEVVSLLSSCVTKEQVQAATTTYFTLQLVTQYLGTEWLARNLLGEMMPFSQLQEELSVVNSTVFREDKVIVPKLLADLRVVFQHA